MTKHVFGKVVVVVVSAVLTASAGAEGLAEYMVDTAKQAIPDSLTGKAGDPVNGKKVAIDRKRGNCLACHQMPIPEQAFHGLIGPPLVGIGARFSPEQLRLRVVDPQVVNPRTIMPSFYKVEGVHRPLKKFAGKPILTAQEVEDVIAYLGTIK